MSSIPEVLSKRVLPPQLPQLPHPPWVPATGMRVQLKGGGVMMTVRVPLQHHGAFQVHCDWQDVHGIPHSAVYLVDMLREVR